MYYDPFANLDPDQITPFSPADKSDKSEMTTFDPGAEEFHPASKESQPIDSNKSSSSSSEDVEEEEDEDSGEGDDQDPPNWQVVAAEYGGKAVAVVIKEGAIYACTSPYFNSQCSHPGLPCLAWDSVVLEMGNETRDTSLASESPLPDGAQNFTDSGYENGFENVTDNSSEQSGEMSNHQVVPESPYLSLDSPGYTVEILPQGYTTSLPEAIALAPDTVIVEHYPQPIVVAEQQYESWVSPDNSSPIHWSSGLGINIPNNLNTEHHSTENAYSSTFTDSSNTYNNGAIAEFNGQMGPLSPIGQTQFINLGGLNVDMAGLDFGMRTERRREKSEEDRLQAREEQRKREEFKNKVLNNLSGSTEAREEMKIRDSFKDQVLSNLRKGQQQKESDEMNIKRAFKDKIMSNLSGGTKS